MNPKQQMDEMCDDISRYRYMMMRQGRKKNVKNLTEYVRRKVNEKFRERNLKIIEGCSFSSIREGEQ